MSDAEDTKQRLELLKMARVLLNEEYINRRAEDHNKWLADCDVAWREQRIKLPYPPFAPYPSEEQIVSKALTLYEFINPNSGKINAATGTLSERESQVVADVVKKTQQEAIFVQPTISPWEKYLTPKLEEPAAAEAPKVEEPPAIEEPKVEAPVVDEEPKIEEPVVAVPVSSPWQTYLVPTEPAPVVEISLAETPNPTAPIEEIFKPAEPVADDSTESNDSDSKDNDYDTTVPMPIVPTGSTTVYSGISAGKDQTGFSSVKSLIPNFWRNRDGDK